MRLFVEVEPSIWRYFHIYGSLIQGGQDGPPVWCLVLHVVLVSACSGLLPEIAADIWFFIFIDDLSISVSTRYAQEVLMRIENVAARYRMVLNRAKNAVHVPARTKDEVGELLAEGAEEALGVEYRWDGLKLMGTVCNGMYAAPLYSGTSAGLGAEHPAFLRLENAQRLARAIEAGFTATADRNLASGVAIVPAENSARAGL
jgi:hypothetical protein